MWKVSLLTVFVFFLAACGRNPSELNFRERRNSPSGGLVNLDEQPLTFESVQKYILKPRCMSCHSGPDAKPGNDPIDFSTYESTMVDRFIPLLIKGKPEESRLYQSIESGEMPEEGTLSNQEIQFVRDWIAACAPKIKEDFTLGDCTTDDGPGDDGPGDDGPGDDGPGDDGPGDDGPGDDGPGDDGPGDDEPID